MCRLYLLPSLIVIAVHCGCSGDSWTEPQSAGSLSADRPPIILAPQPLFRAEAAHPAQIQEVDSTVDAAVEQPQGSIDLDLNVPENRSWFEQVQKQIESDERKPRLLDRDAEGQPLRESRWQFINRRHNMHSWIDSSGWRLEELVVREDLTDNGLDGADAQQADSSGEGSEPRPLRERWWWHYRFLGLTDEGNEISLLIAAASKPSTYEQNGRVFRESSEYITEWFENPESGLKQGFTVTKRPSGAKGPLLLVGEVTTSLNLTDSEPQRLSFSNNGRIVLKRAGLRVVDAAGAALPSGIFINPNNPEDGFSLLFVIDDRGASYPIQID